jgi:hypothetical protein
MRITTLIPGICINDSDPPFIGLLSPGGRHFNTPPSLTGFSGAMHINFRPKKKGPKALPLA